MVCLSLFPRQSVLQREHLTQHGQHLAGSLVADFAQAADQAGLVDGSDLIQNDLAAFSPKANRECGWDKVALLWSAGQR